MSENVWSLQSERCRHNVATEQSNSLSKKLQEECGNLSAHSLNTGSITWRYRFENIHHTSVRNKKFVLDQPIYQPTIYLFQCSNNQQDLDILAKRCEHREITRLFYYQKHTQQQNEKKKIKEKLVETRDQQWNVHNF